MSNTEPVEFSDALNERFIIYASKVLADRALPDARDGLKPSQRRVLVAMNDLSLFSNGGTEKSAKICGDTSGNYHPHGEAVVYPTMYRLVQPWVMREPLLIGQGNFGNPDGDPPAAMRYTEAKLSPFGELLLEELSKDVVPYVANYNEKREEPTVLPAMFPNLLVNGTQGIAVGWATYLPQHNYREVAKVIAAYIKNPNITPAQIIKIMPGPDFPSGGKLLGQDGVIEYYATGRGSIQLEGKWEIVKDGKNEKIVITELPYQASPEKLHVQIAELVKAGKLTGVSDALNLSRGNCHVVIELSRGANAQLIVNNLLKYSSLRTSYSVNQTVLIGDKVVPDASIMQLIKSFVDHRRDVLTKKFNAELVRQNQRLHIIEGLLNVADKIDEVIKIVRQSDDDKMASQKLIASKIVSTQEQADAVLAITLRQLTKLEAGKLLDEKNKREERVKWLTKVLGDINEVDDLIIKEQDELSKKFGTNRKTEITGTVSNIENEDLIKDEQLLVSISGDGYTKTTPLEAFKVQGRGGKGVNNGDSNRDDNVFEMFESGSKDLVLFFSNKGVMYRKKAYEIPQASKTAKGTHVSNLLELSEGETITNMISVKSLSMGGYLIIATKRGLIKRTELSEYDSSRSSITAIKLNDNDQVAFAMYSDGKRDIFIITSNGNCVRYNESLISIQGRATQGCRALKLDVSDSIAQVFSLDKEAEPDILVVTKGGFGKRSESSEFRALGNRNVKGYAVINKSSLTKNGTVVGAAAIEEKETLLVATLNGKVIRIPAESIRSTGRATSGVRVVKLEDGDEVSRLTKLKLQENEEDGQVATKPLKDEKIVDVNIDVNAQGKYGYTKLHEAAITGNEDECNRLIELGALKDIKDNSGRLPWQKAELAGFEKLAERLKP